MPSYSPQQLHLYFERIHYPVCQHASDRLVFLTALQKHQLVWIPFETLSLHYSVNRQVSLDPQDLFEKIVVKGRGGYCLENNTFFSNILESLGFQVMSVICRITYATRGIYDGSWRAMSHMANVVTVNGERYFVDVGYGLDGPCCPLPLRSGEVRAGLPAQQLMLEHKRLPQHKDPGQMVWVYSQRRDPDEWTAVYHFPDVEFFPADFEIINHYTMTQSLWTQVVVAQRFVFSDDDGIHEQRDVSGTMLLLRDTLKTRVGPTEELVKKFGTEDQRIEALERHFGIRLTEDECRAIEGFVSELKSL